MARRYPDGENHANFRSDIELNITPVRYLGDIIAVRSINFTGRRQIYRFYAKYLYYENRVRCNPVIVYYYNIIFLHDCNNIYSFICLSQQNRI